MEKKDKLKYGNSLETQFWNDNVEIDKNSPFSKLVDKLWNSKENYIPTEEERKQFEEEVKKYYKSKKNSTKEF